MSGGSSLGGPSRDAAAAAAAGAFPFAPSSLSSHAHAHQPSVYGRLQQTLRDLEAIDQQLEVLRQRVTGLRDEHYEVSRRISAYCANNNNNNNNTTNNNAAVTFRTSVLDHGRSSSSSSSSSARDGRGALDLENWRDKFATKDAGEVQQLTQRHAALQAQNVALKEQIARLDEEYYAKWQTCMKGLVELPMVTTLARPFSSDASRHDSRSVTPGPPPPPPPAHQLLPEHPSLPLPLPSQCQPSAPIPAPAPASLPLPLPPPAAAAPRTLAWFVPIPDAAAAQHEASAPRPQPAPEAADYAAKHAAAPAYPAAKLGYPDVLVASEGMMQHDREDDEKQEDREGEEAPVIIPAPASASASASAPASAPPPPPRPPVAMAVRATPPRLVPTKRKQTPLSDTVEDDRAQAQALAQAQAHATPADDHRAPERQSPPSPPSPPPPRSPSLPTYPGFPGLTDVIPGKLYQVYYDHGQQNQRGWYLGTPLPWDGDSWQDKLNLDFAMRNMDLGEDFPECYIPVVASSSGSSSSMTKSAGGGSRDSTATAADDDNNDDEEEEDATITGLVGWAPDFEHGGPRVLERSFLFLFFDDRKPRHLVIPKRAGERMHMTKAGLSRVPIDWVRAQDVRTVDDKVEGTLRGTKTGRNFAQMMELFAQQSKSRAQGGAGRSGGFADGELATGTRAQGHPEAPQPEARRRDHNNGAVDAVVGSQASQARGRLQTPIEPVIEVRPLPLRLDLISPRKISLPPASPPFNAEEAGIIVPDSPDKATLDVGIISTDSLAAAPRSANRPAKNTTTTTIDASTIHAVPLPVKRGRKPRRTLPPPPPTRFKTDTFNLARFEVVLPEVMDTSEDTADVATIVASPEQPERGSQEKEEATAPVLLHSTYHVDSGGDDSGDRGVQQVLQNYNYIADHYHYGSSIPVERFSRRLPPIQSLSPELDPSNQSLHLQKQQQQQQHQQQQQLHLPSLRQVFEAQQNQLSTVDLAVAARRQLYNNNKKRKSSSNSDSNNNNTSKIPFGHKEMASYVDRIIDAQRMARLNGEGGEHQQQHQQHPHRQQHRSPAASVEVPVPVPMPLPVQMAPPMPTPFHHRHQVHRPITPQFHHHRMSTTSTSGSPEVSHAQQGAPTPPVGRFGWATR